MLLYKEALILHPILNIYVQKFRENDLYEYDLVAIFLLLCLSVRRPQSWCNGRLKAPILSCESCFLSVTLTQLPIFVEFLGSEYLRKILKIQSFERITVIELFNLLQLKGIKNNVDSFLNKSIVMWAARNRPFKLMFTIPSPMQVLKVSSIVYTLFWLFI